MAGAAFCFPRMKKLEMFHSREIAHFSFGLQINVPPHIEQAEMEMGVAYAGH